MKKSNLYPFVDQNPASQTGDRSRSPVRAVEGVHRLLKSLLALSVGLALSSEAKASLLVSDDFNYDLTAGTQLLGSSVAASDGTGFSSGYKQTTDAQVWTYNTNSLSFSSNYATSGGSASVAAMNAAKDNVFRTLSANLSGVTYGSYLFQTSSRADPSGVLGVFVSGSASTDYPSTLDLNANAYGSNLGASGGVGTSNNYFQSPQTGGKSTGLSLNTTYMMLWTADLEPTLQSVTAWVLTSAQYDYFFANGFSVSALNSAVIGSDASDVTSKGSFSKTGTLGDISTLHLFATNRENATLDEIKIGTTLADVTISTVPEPSTYALLMGGLGLLVARFRRRVA